VVGLKGWVLKFEVLEDTELWHQVIMALMVKCAMLPDTYGIGTWLCREGAESHVHMDVVVHTLDKMYATQLALAFNQLAVYDVANKQALWLTTRREDEDTLPPGEASPRG